MDRTFLLADIIRQLLATGPQKLPLNSNECLAGLQIFQSRGTRGSERGEMAGCCDGGNEHSVSIKLLEFFDLLRNC